MYQCKLRKKFRQWAYPSAANVYWLKALLVTALLLSSTLQTDRYVLAEWYFLNNLDFRALLTHLILPDSSGNSPTSSLSVRFEV